MEEEDKNAKLLVFEAKDEFYKPLSVLGSCSENNGIVQLARHIPSQQVIAIKRYNVDKLKEDAYLIQVKIRQVLVLIF